MPKKIPDLENKILTQAQRLFLEQGYSAVAMKEVALAVGTSVGNLYNYFASKPALFMAVSERWQKSLLAEITAVEPEWDDRTKLEGTIVRLVTILSRRLGMWEEFLNPSSNELSTPEAKALFGQLRTSAREWVVRHFDSILAELANRNSALRHLRDRHGPRLTMLLITTAKMLALSFPDQDEANQAFVADLNALLLSDLQTGTSPE